MYSGEEGQYLSGDVFREGGGAVPSEDVFREGGAVLMYSFREVERAVPIRRCIQGRRRRSTYHEMYSGKEEGQYLSEDVFRRGGAVPIRRCIHSGKKERQYLSGDVGTEGGWAVPNRRFGKGGRRGSTY